MADPSVSSCDNPSLALRCSRHSRLKGARSRIPRRTTAALPWTPHSPTKVLLPSASPELAAAAVATSGAVPSPMETVGTAGTDGGADTTGTRRGAAASTGAVGAAAPRMMAPMAGAASTKKATKKRNNDSAPEQGGEPETKRLLHAGAGKWSEEEDAALSKGVARRGPKGTWEEISNLLPGRTHEECRFRWGVIRPNQQKGGYSADEDAVITAAVNTHGATDAAWREAFDIFKNNGAERRINAIKVRYTGKLDPSLKPSGNWTTEEDQAILDGRQAGNTWGAIAATTPGRAPNDVKNRFNGRLKRTLHLK